MDSKQNIIKPNTWLLAARILTLAVSAGILISSFFFYDPEHDVSGNFLNPQLNQTLLYGGIAVLLGMYSWWRPVFGGMTTVLYGLYKIFGHPGNLISGHNPFTRSLFTLVPAPLYYTLYGLLVIGGILCIISGWKTRKTSIEETGVSKRLRKITLVTNICLAAAAGIYGIIVSAAMLVSSYSPDYFVWSLFSLVPLSLVLARIAWKFPAQGGLLEILAGVFWLVMGKISNWQMPVFIPYAVICGMLISAGILNIFRGFMVRKT